MKKKTQIRFSDNELLTVSAALHMWHRSCLDAIRQAKDDEERAYWSAQAENAYTALTAIAPIPL